MMDIMIDDKEDNDEMDEKIEKMKVRVPQDKYFAYKDEMQGNEYIEYIPTNMYGQTVPVGKSGNMENIKHDIKKRLGCAK